MVALFLLITLCISLAYAVGNYSLKLSNSQLRALQQVIINQTDGTCQPLSTNYVGACDLYCNYVFYYNQHYPNKNARLFNQTTKKCYPMSICKATLIVIYNQTANQCRQTFYDYVIPSMNATRQSDYDKFPTWTVVCKNGDVVKDDYGDPICLCAFGYESTWNTDTVSRISVCDRIISLKRYLPPDNRAIYNVYNDVLFPKGVDPYYFLKAFFYGIKMLKYYILNYFQPYELQIATVILQTDDLITKTQIPYIVIIGCIFILVIYLTCRQNCLQQDLDNDIMIKYQKRVLEQDIQDEINMEIRKQDRQKKEFKKKQIQMKRKQRQQQEKGQDDQDSVEQQQEQSVNNEQQQNDDNEVEQSREVQLTQNRLSQNVQEQIDNRMQEEVQNNDGQQQSNKQQQQSNRQTEQNNNESYAIDNQNQQQDNSQSVQQQL